MRSPEAQALLEEIRLDIQRYGRSIVGCDKLLLLISASDPIGVQYGHILHTALSEGWSFEFRADGTVRFASLKGDAPVIDALEYPIDRDLQSAQS